jgi:hypothetical protein
VVGQQGHVLLHSATPVWVGEGGANGGGGLGRRPEEWQSYQRPGSSGRRGGERRRRAESTLGGRARGHGEWRPGGTQAARCGPPGRRGRGHGRLAVVMDVGGVSKASRARRRPRVSGR